LALSSVVAMDLERGRAALAPFPTCEFPRVEYYPEPNIGNGRVPIANWIVPKRAINNRQLKIHNVQNHPLTASRY